MKRNSLMIPEKFFRYSCLVTAVANGAGNLGLMLFYRPLLDMLGAPQPLDIHYFYWMSGLSFTNGVLAYFIFSNPEKNTDLLKVGITGKGIFFLMSLYFYAFHGIHWFFLILGAWDGAFAFLFWLYLIRLQATGLSMMNRGEILPRAGRRTYKAAVIYYSLTGTGSGAVERIRKGLETKGYSVDVFNIAAMEKDLFRFPFGSPVDFFRIAARAILRRPARIEPPGLPSEHDYDLIIVETQTWFVGMSAPVEALFLDDANRAFFSGRDAAVLTVCRGLWRRSQAMVVAHLERFGANVVGARAYTHQGWEPSRVATLFAYLIYGEVGRPGWLSWFLQSRYGLSRDSLDDVEEYGKSLAGR